MSKFYAVIISFVIMFSSTSFAEMKITSQGIIGLKIQKIHACRKKGGKDLSPQISVTGIPNDATHLAIIIDDPDARSVAGQIWIHWNVFNIPVNGKSYNLESGEKPLGKMASNSWGYRKYGGMCPPNGKHTYRFGVFALNSEIKARTRTIDLFKKKNKNIIVGEGLIEGDFR